MKQVLHNLRSGETVVAEVPVPVVKPGFVLVRTVASLVSAGTERMVVEFAEKSLVGKARSRPDLLKQVVDKARREGVLTTVESAFIRLDQPMALGYSSAGRITVLGDGVQGYQKGQRVACAGGGYAVHAEYAAVPVNLLATLPDGVGYESAAFATLGAIAMHGCRLAEMQLGERVAVIGLGLLGLLATAILRAAGCRVLGIDLSPRRAALAQAMGGEGVRREDAESAAAVFSRGRGCDAVLICADSDSDDPVELAGLIARDRARVVAVGAVGLNLPRKIYYEKELTFINSRSYGPGRYDSGYEERGQDYPIGFVRWTEGRNLEAIIDLLAEGRLDVSPLITHRFPVEDAAQAYALITGKRDEPYLGVLLTYPGDAPVELGAVRQEAAVGEADTSSAALPLLQPEPAPTAAVDRVRLGVLGAGSFTGTVMLPALKSISGIELAGIASASGSSARHAADKFGFRYAASSQEQILGDAAINTVAVLTRHHLHARQVIAALSAGKHVFCEKPLAINEEELADIEALLGAVSPAEPGSPPARLPLLTVGFNRRFAPLAVQLKAFLEGHSEPLALHYRVNAGYLPPTHWLHDPRQGGGRIIGEGCHFIDFLVFLVGETPNAVTAQGLPDGGRYREDNLVLTFSFPGGSVGTISYLANGDKSYPKERLEVFSAGRVAVLDDFRSLALVRDGRRRTLQTRLRQDKGHRAEWEAFSQAIITGGPPPIHYSDLLGVTRASFTALSALRTGERVLIRS
jgi:predicted dehydrogenase